MEHELARLPVTEREALTLFYLRELSLAEVAEVLDVPLVLLVLLLDPIHAAAAAGRETTST
jgi:Sigma-70, region 4